VRGVIVNFPQVIGWISQSSQYRTSADGHLKLSRSVVPVSVFYRNLLTTFLTRMFLFFLSFSRVKGTCRSRKVLRVARGSIKKPSSDVHKHNISTVSPTPRCPDRTAANGTGSFPQGENLLSNSVTPSSTRSPLATSRRYWWSGTIRRG